MSEFIWTDELVAEFPAFLHENQTNSKYLGQDLIKVFKDIKSQTPPLFNTSDGYDVYANNRYFQVASDFSVWKKPARTGLNYNEQSTKNTFSTKEAAEEYVLMNKPCLSANDVTNMMYNLSRENFNDEIKELAKSKL